MNIKFVKIPGVKYSIGINKIIRCKVFTPVYTTRRVKFHKGLHMHDPQTDTLPGLSLQEWLEASEVSYSAFSRLVPCSISYPRLIAKGLARPSYEMACRIETLTHGTVPRERWYPPGEAAKPESSNIGIEDMLND